MRLFAGKKKQSLTRRELAAQRQAATNVGPDDVHAYKRSRTMTRRGHPTDEPSERQASWELRRKRRKLTAWLLGVSAGALCLIGLLSQLTASFTLQTPDGRADQKTYLTVLEEYYKVRPIERLRFMLNEAALNTFFLEKTPEVQSVRVEAGSQLASGVLLVSFRQPVAQWSSGGVVYFVDDSGVTFEKNYFPAPNIAVSDQSGVPAAAGQEVINRRFLSFLGQSVSLFQKNGLVVVEVVLPPDTVRQVEFRLQDVPYSIKMTVDRGAVAQVNEAVRTKRFLDERGESPSYIDVRVDQRVFYK